ncbi:hypothetical protein [Bacillus massiliglaciei]|uniref:hypothetical protein n=1 Tax=Bacillus massiliglaciei TaxID=1816693 RepID=UPI001F434A09|nr:hypothetical protein [Bacillus massiliglaciei]
MLAGGLTAYFMITDDELNWFIGNILSLALPFAVILLGLPFTKKKYNFSQLKEYQPDHTVQHL